MKTEVKWKHKGVVTKVVKESFDLLWHVHYKTPNGIKTYDRVEEAKAKAILRQLNGKAKHTVVRQTPTRDELDKLVGQDGRIEVVVPLTLSELMKGVDEVDSLVEKRILPQDGTGDCLEDMSFTPIGVEGENVLVLVNAEIEYTEGTDVCSKCGKVRAANTMKAKSETDFDLLCDECWNREWKRTNARIKQEMARAGRGKRK
jgi:hypothetical protein